MTRHYPGMKDDGPPQWVEVPPIGAELMRAQALEALAAERSLWLDCESPDSCGRWVLHRYAHRKMADGLPVIVEHVYRCTGCGHLKRFGVE